MKKFLYPVLALGAVVAMTSCSSEEPLGPNDRPNDGKVTFNINLEGAQTRAFGETVNCNQITYTVFDMDGKVVLSDQTETAFTGGATTATVELQLVANQKYKVIFYANNSGSTFSSYNEGVVTVSYDNKKVNSNIDDAFINKKTYTPAGGTAVENQVFTADGNAKTVYLTRPFAQVNIGTNDLTNTAVQNIIDNVSTEFTVSNGLFTQYSALAEENVVSVPYSGTYTATTGKPEINTDFPVDGYSNLLSVYLLVPEAKDVINAEYAINLNGSKGSINTLNLSGMPVQMNYRTNVYGSLLTTQNKFDVTIEPAFDGINNVEIQTVSTPEQAAAAVAQGGTVKVTAPLDMIDLTASTPAKPLTLMISSPVSQIKLGTTEANPQQTTIVVAKDVAYPEFVMPGKNGAIRNLTVKGDVASSQKLNGFVTNNKGVKNVENLTFDNVPFEGIGVNLAYSANPQIVTGITIKNCVFTNLTQPLFTVSGNQYAGETMGDITITGNTASFASNAASNANGVNMWYLNTGSVTVADNTITNAPYHGIQIASCSIPVTATGNTIVDAHHDGIKLDGNKETVTCTDNSVMAYENGIRVKNFPASNTVIVTGNTVDMSKTIAFNNGEPWGILVIGNNTESVINLTVSGNKKVGTNEHWFEVTGVNTSATSNYAQPWVN